MEQVLLGPEPYEQVLFGSGFEGDYVVTPDAVVHFGGEAELELDFLGVFLVDGLYGDKDV